MPSSANPSEEWLEKDAKVMQFLLRHLSVKLKHLVNRCTTSAPIWSTLQRNYASKEPIDQMKLGLDRTLLKLNKGEPLKQYRNRVQQLAHQLEQVDNPVRKNNQVLAFLRGLPRDGEHRAIIQAITLGVQTGQLTWERVDIALKYDTGMRMQFTTWREIRELFSLQDSHKTRVRKVAKHLAHKGKQQDARTAAFAITLQMCAESLVEVHSDQRQAETMLQQINNIHNSNTMQRQVDFYHCHHRQTHGVSTVMNLATWSSSAPSRWCKGRHKLQCKTMVCLATLEAAAMLQRKQWREGDVG